uniref:Uncharacterized protein n=1 Tax=Arundo donax TaxID=35708 RepID=A0A0A9FP49_ARUDO
MCTTSRMVGRAVLASSTHAMATLYRSTISATGSGVRRRSATARTAAVSDVSGSSAVTFRTQWTMSTPSPKLPTGRRPVMSSSRTTPKL